MNAARNILICLIVGCMATAAFARRPATVRPTPAKNGGLVKKSDIGKMPKIAVSPRPAMPQTEAAHIRQAQARQAARQLTAAWRQVHAALSTVLSRQGDWPLVPMHGGQRLYSFPDDNLPRAAENYRLIGDEWRLSPQ